MDVNIEGIEPLEGGEFRDYLAKGKWESCERCPLHETRMGAPVFGTGELNQPPIMFVGEAPGVSEEEHGEPFVGASGELLYDVFDMFEIENWRKRFRFTNVVMCRPNDPRNPRRCRPPESAEIKPCRERLFEEIYHADPLLVVALGAVASKAVGGAQCTISKNIGDITQFSLSGKSRGQVTYPLLVTWHPSYVLRKFDSRTGIPLVGCLLDLFLINTPYHNMARDILVADSITRAILCLQAGEPIPNDIKEVFNAMRFTSVAAVA